MSSNIEEGATELLPLPNPNPVKVTTPQSRPVRRQRKTKGLSTATKRTLIVIGKTLAITIGIAVFLVLPIAEIIIGSIHLENCPAEDFLPKYLIGSGVVVILAPFIIYGTCYSSNTQSDVDGDGVCYTAIILFGWTIAGAIFVYGRKEPNFEDPEAENYCHISVFLCVFVSVTVNLSLEFLSILGCSGLAIYVCFFKK